MFAIIYLGIAYLLGFALCRFFFPGLSDFARRDIRGETMPFSPLFVMLPAWLYFGILPLTWTTYLLAVLYAVATRETENPLLPANMVAMAFALVAAFLLLKFSVKRRPIRLEKSWFSTVRVPEILGFLFCAVLTTLLMLWTLHVRDGRLYVGVSVFGDFTPHLSMIRSFSRGINFPTIYTPFAGSDVKYHFLYMFLCGNLEYLGLRLDVAFNLPTIIGFLSTTSLLYAFTVRLWRRKIAGGLAVGFFLFRSSPSILTFLSKQPKGQVWEGLLNQQAFTDYTPNESWGLWTLNVYVNQRHFAFTLGVLILFIMLYTQIFWDGWRRLERFPVSGPGLSAWLRSRVGCFVRESLLSKEGWKPVLPEELETPAFAGRKWAALAFPILAGLYIGMLSFWNGAVLIACLLVLFVLAVLGDGRLSYLITAVVALLLTLIQSRAFIQENAFSVRYFFGFITENKTFFGVLNYIWLLTGLSSILVLIFFAVSDGKRRGLLCAFSAPFLFAFTISLTTDPTVNHKYIMVTMMLIALLLGGFVAKLFEQSKKVMERACLVLLCVALMAMGVFETYIVFNENRGRLSYSMSDETTKWIMENSGYGDIFLSNNYSLNNVLLSGAWCFEIWPYYAWSAGYPTAARDAQVRRMYEAETPSELRAAAEENNIAYIIVEDDNRTTPDYVLNEDNIAETFEAVFHSDERNLTIYKVS